MARDNGFYFAVGTDGNRALARDDGKLSLQVAADFSGDLNHGGQVGLAVFLGRGADGDEDDFGFADGLFVVQGKKDSFGGQIFLEELFQSRFIDNRIAFFQLFDFLARVSDDVNLVAKIGKDASRYQPNVAMTDYCYCHK